MNEIAAANVNSDSAATRAIENISNFIPMEN